MIASGVARQLMAQLTHASSEFSRANVRHILQYGIRRCEAAGGEMEPCNSVCGVTMDAEGAPRSRGDDSIGAALHEFLAQGRKIVGSGRKDNGQGTVATTLGNRGRNGCRVTGRLKAPDFLCRIAHGPIVPVQPPPGKLETRAAA